MYRLLLLFVVALQAPAFAQRVVPWPRNATTNRVDFRGHLFWPDSVKSELQRQTLVRRWYRRGLTNENVAEIRRMIQRNGTGYAGIPRESHYTHSIVDRDLDCYKLYFQLALISDSTGLTYQLADFECGETTFDAGISASLEEALKVPNAQVQTIIEGFHQRLLLALRSWN